jgi:hypothetical protein
VDAGVADINTSQEADTQSLSKTLAIYGEVCRSYHAVDDFRAKLLAALPIVSGAGGILLLAHENTVKGFLGPIGVFGMLVTLGLFSYEFRGLRNCGALIDRGRKLEEKLDHLEHGQFSGLEAGWRQCLPLTAAVIVYGATLAGWMFVAGVGFGWWPLG